MDTSKLVAMQIALEVAKSKKVVTLILENVTLHSSEDLLQNVINLMELGALEVAIIATRDLSNDELCTLGSRLFDGDVNDFQLFKKDLEELSSQKYTCRKDTVSRLPDKDRIVVIRNKNFSLLKRFRI